MTLFQAKPNRLQPYGPEQSNHYAKKICPGYTLSNFLQLAEIEDLHPNLSTDLSVFTLKIGHQNLLFFIDLFDYVIISWRSRRQL